MKGSRYFSCQKISKLWFKGFDEERIKDRKDPFATEVFQTSLGTPHSSNIGGFSTLSVMLFWSFCAKGVFTDRSPPHRGSLHSPRGRPVARGHNRRVARGAGHARPRLRGPPLALIPPLTPRPSKTPLLRRTPVLHGIHAKLDLPCSLISCLLLESNRQFSKKHFEDISGNSHPFSS